MNIRLPQSLTRRRPADQRACGLWVRDCAPPNKATSSPGSSRHSKWRPPTPPTRHFDRREDPGDEVANKALVQNKHNELDTS